jgi:hypothetical protein
VALHALAAGEQIRSARCVCYLREFIAHLPPAGSRGLAGFREQAAESLSRRDGHFAKNLQFVAANLLAAMCAAIEADADGESDPLADLRDELADQEARHGQAMFS